MTFAVSVGNRLRRNRPRWNPIRESGKRKTATGIDGECNRFVLSVLRLFQFQTLL